MKTNRPYLSDSNRYLLKGSLVQVEVMSGIHLQRVGVLFLSLAVLAAALILQTSFISIAFSQDDEIEAEVQNEKNTNGFFPAETKWFDEGSAQTVFTAESVKSESPDVGFYKEHEEKKEVPEEDQFNQPSVMQMDAQGQPVRPPFDTKKASKDQLVGFFGNPDEEAPLTPEDKAPKPFKGMMAAMDSGNDELAYKYARQYVRYVNNMTKRVQKVGQLQEVAIEREGIRKGMLKDNPYKELLEQDLEDERADPNEIDNALSEVDPATAKILKKARLDESGDIQDAGSFNASDRTVESGPIDVMVFVSVGENASMKMAQEIERVRKAMVNSPQIGFTGFIVNNASGADREQFLRSSGASFEMQSGAGAVKALGIRISPTVLIVARNSMKTVRIEDSKSAGEILSILNKFQGGAL